MEEIIYRKNDPCSKNTIGILVALQTLHRYKPKKFNSGVKAFIYISFAYLFSPWVSIVLFIPSLLIPIVEEAALQSISKAVEKIMNDKFKEVPRSYDLFKKRIDEIEK